MLKANIGWSTEADNFEAGRTSAKKAVVDLVQTKVAFCIHHLIMMLRKC